MIGHINGLGSVMVNVNLKTNVLLLMGEVWTVQQLLAK